MVRTTLMMVTYNRLDLTKKTFDTTFSNAGEKFNLIIIDNASKDRTVEWLEENIKTYPLIKNYKIVKMSENKGIAYGRNMCLKIYDDNFSTPYLSTVDNDVELPENWLKDCCDVLDNNSKICSCGVNLEGVRYNKAFVKAKNRNIEIQIKPRGNLGTAATVFSKEVHDKIGFFCNDYKIYAHEDADFFFSCSVI
jgi:GT2 family glycosyltransferase